MIHAIVRQTPLKNKAVLFFLVLGVSLSGCRAGNNSEEGSEKNESNLAANASPFEQIKGKALIYLKNATNTIPGSMGQYAFTKLTNLLFNPNQDILDGIEALKVLIKAESDRVVDANYKATRIAKLETGKAMLETAILNRTSSIIYPSVSGNLQSIQSIENKFNEAYSHLKGDGVVMIHASIDAGQQAINEIQRKIYWKMVQKGTYTVYGGGEPNLVDEDISNLRSAAKQLLSSMTSLITAGEESFDKVEYDYEVVGGTGYERVAVAGRGAPAMSRCLLRGAKYQIVAKVKNWYGWGSDHSYVKNVYVTKDLPDVVSDWTTKIPGFDGCSSDSVRASLARSDFEKIKEVKLILEGEIKGELKTLRDLSLGPNAAEYKKTALLALEDPIFPIRYDYEEGMELSQRICAQVGGGGAGFIPYLNSINCDKKPNI